jgi:serine/threonine protein kinase
MVAASDTRRSRRTALSEAEADPYLGRVIAQRYKLARCVGRGGMGAVYDAMHVQTEKRVAVKILAPRLSRDLKLITRFRREAMAASRLDHENCVAVYDFGEDTDGTFYITMEYVDGVGLGQDIKKNGPMTAERCIHVGVQLLSALDAAHASGILHRDLKPQNIMLTRVAGRDDVVKVVDFGIAKFIDNSPEDQVALTIPGTIFGTPEYMSPEQARGESLDARSDVYSAAVVLWHCLLGRSPFRGKTVRETLTKVFSDDPPSPVAERPGADIPAALLDALSGALVKERDQRTPDAATFLAEVQRLSTRNVSLGPPQQFAPTPGILPDGSAPETLADDEHSNPRLRRPRVPTEVGHSPSDAGAAARASAYRGAVSDERDGPELPPPEMSRNDTDVFASASSLAIADAVTAPLLQHDVDETPDEISRAPQGVMHTNAASDTSARVQGGADVDDWDRRANKRRVWLAAFAALIVVGVALVFVWPRDGGDGPDVLPERVVVVDLAAPAPDGFVKDETACETAMARARDLVAQASSLNDEERREREDAALIAYADAIRQDPEHAAAHRGYATLLFQHRRFREARRHIERAIALDESSRAHFVVILKLIEMTERSHNNAADAGAQAIDDAAPSKAD